MNGDIAVTVERSRGAEPLTSIPAGDAKHPEEHTSRWTGCIWLDLQQLLTLCELIEYRLNR
jgi:hypothetical protein